jgi:hypothetical protein
MELTENFDTADLRAKDLADSLPRALSAVYDDRLGRVVIHLNSKLHVTFDPQDAEGLQDATSAQLEPIEISPSGFGLHFPKLDADIYLPALLEGLLGSQKWMARTLGAKGGQAKTEAKTAASRANGRLGGRPKKQTTAVA